MKGKTLAIDYGERRIGLALSDELGIIATGAGTIPNDSNTLRSLYTLIQDRNVDHVIVGMPLLLAGTRGTSAVMVAAFIDELRSQVSVAVEAVDERFTSVMAEQTIRQLGVGRKKRREKGKVDEIAAVILLQGYLDMK